MMFRELAARYAPNFDAYASPEKYALARRRWCEELGELAAADVTAGHLEPFLSHRKLAGLAPKTIAQDLGYVRRLYAWAIRDRLLDYNPAAELQVHVPPNERTRWLTDEEEARLRAVFTSHLWGRVEFALLTGLRANEQWRMRREDIEWSKRQMVVTHQKGGGSRTIPLSQRALDILREELGAHDSEWVWPSGRGYHQARFPWYSKSSACHLMTGACKRAGIPHCNWHALRHTFATRLVRQGEDIRTIADLLGHRNIQMTMRYLKADPVRSRAAVDGLAANRPEMPPLPAPKPKAEKPARRRAELRVPVEIKLEHGTFDATAAMGTNVHVFLDNASVQSRLVSGRQGWPEAWLYRGRPLGQLELVWGHLVSREGQRALARVISARESGRPSRALERLRRTLHDEAVAGVDLEPYLRGEACPCGWTNRELWSSLTEDEQAAWETRLFGEVS